MRCGRQKCVGQGLGIAGNDTQSSRTFRKFRNLYARVQVTWVTKFCKVSSSVCGSSIWNLLHVFFWRLQFWLLDFHRFVHPCIYFLHTVLCLLTVSPSNENRGDVVVQQLGCDLDGPGFESQQGTGTHSTSYSIVIRVFPVVKRPEREFNHSPPSSAWFKMIVSIRQIPLYAVMWWTGKNLYICIFFFIFFIYAS